MPESKDLITLTADVLVAHHRDSIERCHCGWADLGRSHAEHVARVLAGAGLLVGPWMPDFDADVPRPGRGGRA